MFQEFVWLFARARGISGVPMFAVAGARGSVHGSCGVRMLACLHDQVEDPEDLLRRIPVAITARKASSSLGLGYQPKVYSAFAAASRWRLRKCCVC